MQKRMHAGRRWWLAGVVAVALLAVAGLGGIRPAAAEVGNPDPEPFVDPDMPVQYVPGPGWPEGWQPPAEPTEIPQSEVENFNYYRSLPGVQDKPERLEMRVLRPLPAWTKEYPYYWVEEPLQCGKTVYVYWYPAPSQGLIYQWTGDKYTFTNKPLASIKAECQFVPITSIRVTRAMTPEEKEQIQLEDQMVGDEWASRGGSPSQGGLENCRTSTDNGTLDNIMVCFNRGDASRRFDAPAYLDIHAGRVRVPLRFISEMMGGQVTWDPATRTVSLSFPAISRQVVRPISRPGFTREDWWEPEAFSSPNYKALKWEVQTVSQPERQLVLTVGKEIALVDGNEMRIDAAPVIQPPGRVMVPVRFIAEALGAKVFWVGAQPLFPTDSADQRNGRYQVHIYTVFHPFYEYPNWVLEHAAQKF